MLGTHFQQGDETRDTERVYAGRWCDQSCKNPTAAVVYNVSINADSQQTLQLLLQSELNISHVYRGAIPVRVLYIHTVIIDMAVCLFIKLEYIQVPPEWNKTRLWQDSA